MISFFPLVFSLVAAVLFFTGDYGPITKGLFGLMTVAAATMQFVPSLREQVHFLIPLFMQIFVCGAYYIASQFE